MTLLFAVSVAGQTAHPELWPRVKTGKPDPAIEKRVDDLMSKMTLEEKVAQTMQPSIVYVTPEDVRTYHFGSILNGGGGWPGDVRKATPRDWLAKADAYYDASMDTSGGKQAIPIIWGLDAVHGHNNIIGATLFPHNIALGCTRDAELVRNVGAITATEIRVTGQDWDFFPTLAVVQDPRWGRTYESYSHDPALVKKLGTAFIEGVQSKHIFATAKHFLGDGGTEGGKDQGDNKSTEEQLRDIHARGYIGALGANVDTIMVSYNSWRGVKMHGNRSLLTEVLKNRMGFDGFLIGDWNGHAQVPGCTNASCPQSMNAGLDMYMVPEDWKALYTNTLAQVRSGEIPMARLDDAVRRILRVKFREGLFDEGRPSARPNAGDMTQLGSAEHRDVARRAVRESLVLLKNNGHTLPLDAKKRILVAGDGADSIAKQTGGWTISWQGTENTNADFPGATSIWEGIRKRVESSGGHAVLSVDGSFTEKPDVAVVIYGEDPYAEFQGDRRTLIYTDPERLIMLKRLRDAGVSVVSVFLSGRPLWVNPFLNASNTFVAAWLPGTEGEGVADVLFGDHDFSGKLSFAWPQSHTASFPRGYGLTSKDHKSVPKLPVNVTDADNADPNTYFLRGREVAPWSMTTTGAATIEPEGQEAKLVRWSGNGAVQFAPRQAIDLTREANANLAIALTLAQRVAPTGDVTLSVVGGTPVVLRPLSANEWQTVRIRLRCFGSDLSHVTGFTISSTTPAAIAVSDVKLVPATEGGQTECK